LYRRGRERARFAPECVDSDRLVSSRAILQYL
jgi:hypothetical protein